MSNEQYINDNEHAWDKRAENNDQWSILVSEEEIAEAEGYSWSHPIENQIQGQIDAGFVICGFYEDRGCFALDNYINTSMATKAVKV